MRGEDHKYFTEEKVEECKDLFDSLDKSGTGFVVVKDLRDIFAKLDKDIEISYIGDAFRKLTPGWKRYIDFGGYVSILKNATEIYAKDAVSAMGTMFRLADNDEDGVISMNSFKTLLDILLGEKNTQEKADILSRALKIDANYVTFNTFVEILCGIKA